MSDAQTWVWRNMMNYGWNVPMPNPTTWRSRAMLVAAGLALSPTAALAETDGGLPYAGNLGQAIAAVLIFLVLLAALRKWAWKPLLHQIDQRERMIADAIQRAEQRESEAQDMLNHCRARLDAAGKEADEIRTGAEADSQARREQVLAEAREEARRLGEDARKAIDRAREQALRELYESTAKLATDVAGRVMRKSLDPQEQQRLLNQSLDEIRRQIQQHKE